MNDESQCPPSFVDASPDHTDARDCLQAGIPALSPAIASVRPDAGWQETDIVLLGVKLVCEYLLAAEANYLCGVEPGAQPSLCADTRGGYLSGWRKCNIRTSLGVIRLRFPVLQCLHARPSMSKRFRRLQDMLITTIRAIYKTGVSSPSVATLIKTMWTVSLPAGLLGQLTQELCMLLDNWRKNPSMTPWFFVVSARRNWCVRAASVPAPMLSGQHDAPAVPPPEVAWPPENDCAII